MSSLSKSQRRQLLREQDEAAQLASDLARERQIGEDVNWRGAGERIVQLRSITSFEGGHIWDIRQVNGQLKLYLSVLNPDKPGFLKPGYTQVNVIEEELREFVSQLERMSSLSLLPATGNIGCDGATTTLIVKRGFAQLSISWWETGPVEWQEICKLGNQMVEQFGKFAG